LADIARAACKVFTAKGYRRTLMTDVARELGFSHGVLYRYVAGKEALFQLALLYAASPDAIVDLPTPLPTPAPGETLRPLTRWTAGNSTFPALGAALATDECADVHREFTGVVDELYSVIEDHHVLLALIESSAIDIPELDAVYFGQARGGHVHRLQRYLEMRIGSGLLRAVPDTALATRFVIETVAWFAWHRRDDRDGGLIGDDEARTSVLYLLGSAFVPDGQFRPPEATEATEPTEVMEATEMMEATEPTEPTEAIGP
jgi:AcrR family transcriptional regulator